MSIRNIILSVLLFAVFVIVQMPASQLSRLIDLPPQYKLGAIQGTLWSGNSAFIATPDLLIENVSWQLSPWQLLLARLSVDITFGNSADTNSLKGSGQVVRSLFGWSASGVSLSAPATRAVDYMPLPIPVDFDGRFTVKIDQFEQGQPWCNFLGGQVAWRQAAIIAPTGEIPLGALQATLGCDQGQVTLVLADNDVGINLEMAVGDKMSTTVNGYLAPKTTTPEQLIDAVKMISRADNQGRFRFDYKS